ncbi:MAG: GIY-YIG nuclease family protein [Bacteroidia bacterium]
MFYIYIIYSASAKKYYLGYSANPFNRLRQHIESKGEKYTGMASDWEMKAVFKVSPIEAEAMKIEKFIKKQKSRKLIETLCNQKFIPAGKLAQLIRVPHMRD